MKLGEFVGTRARFQRLRDSKIFNGWIDQMAGNRVVLGLTGEHLPTIGDEYRVEGYGHLVSVVFLAKLETILTVDASSARVLPVPLAENSHPATSDVRLEFLVASAVRMVESSETVRYKLKKVAVQIRAGSTTFAGMAVDASFTGIGVSCDQPVEPGANVALAVTTPLGTIGVTAVCRHCRDDAEHQGKHRAGFQFLEFGRVDKPKWDRFITNLR